MADEIQVLGINFKMLMSVCSSRLFTECFDNPEDYDYEEYCNAADKECCKANCPVWKRWETQDPHEVRGE